MLSAMNIYRLTTHNYSRVGSQVIYHDSENSNHDFYNYGMSIAEERKFLARQFIEANEKVYEQRSQQASECAICQGTLEPDDTVRLLPCRHAFHTDCIDTWLERSTRCPTCRAAVA